MMIQSVFICACLVASSIKGAHGSQNTDVTKAIELAANLEATIELSIAMENLSGFALLARPFCIIFTRPVKGRIWRRYDSTERLSGTNNPVFGTKVRIPYLLKDKQELMFRIYNKYHLEGEEDRVVPKGRATCKPADLLSAGGRLKLMSDSKPSKKKGKGYAVVYAEKLKNPYDRVTMKLMSDNARNKKVCGGPNHYLEIYQRVEFEQEDTENKENYIMVYRTEAKQSDFYGTKFDWEKISIPFSTLCGSDRKRELKFVCLRGDERIGEFKTSVQEVETDKSVFPVTNEEKKRVGEITILDFSISYVPSFTEFIAAGLRLRLTIAVDFSRRKNLMDPESFHYQGSGESKCEKAIRLVVTAFEDFVRNDQYDIRGFGAEKDVGQGTPVYDFPLYEDDSDGADGLEGVLQAYRDALHDTSIRIKEEADIAPTIHTFVDKTKSQTHVPSSKKYFVLVVITTGEIMAGSRMSSVLEQLRMFQYPPLSIIFVGIGVVRFTNLNEFFKNASLTLHGQSSFLFIPESELESDEDTQAYRKTEVLAELPKQVASYMNLYGLKPGDGQT